MIVVELLATQVLKQVLDAIVKGGDVRVGAKGLKARVDLVLKVFALVFQLGGKEVVVFSHCVFNLFQKHSVVHLV